MEIRAKVYWLTTEEGGRRNPIASGYRRQTWFGRMMTGEEFHTLPQGHPHGHILNREWQDCWVTLEDERGSALPGERCMIIAKPLVPDLIRDIAKPGLEFEICEGSRLIARGTVLEILETRD